MELWKIKNRLRLNRVNLSASAKEILNNRFADYNTIGDYIINLGNNVYVSVNFDKNSIYMLDYKDKKFSLYESNKLLLDSVEMHIVPKTINEYFTNSFGQKVLVGDYIAQHGSRIRWMPNCDNYLCSNNCKFCEVWANKAYISTKTPEDFEYAFNILQKNTEEKITELLVSGGTPKNNKLSYDYMNSIYEKASEISKNYNLKLDIMYAPRGYYCDEEAKSKNISLEENYKLFFEFLKDIQVSDIAINMELWNNKYREELIPLKNEYTREDYLKYLELGVKILGNDIIRSGLIVGFEPVEDTLTATEELARRKIRIIYSPYEPYLIADNDNPNLDYQFRLKNIRSEGIRARFTKFNLTIDEEDELTLKGYSICNKYGVGFGSKYPSSNHNNLSI